jgi:hypothetical protein
MFRASTFQLNQCKESVDGRAEASGSDAVPSDGYARP